MTSYEGEALPGIRLVPIDEHGWTDDVSYMRQVTCLNHPTALYITKNPYRNTLFLIVPPQDLNTECDCESKFLAVWVDENGSDRTKGTKYHAESHPDYPDLRPSNEGNTQGIDGIL